MRAAVLVLLSTAALAYAPSLTPALNRANVVVLAPTLLWTVLQYLAFYRRPRLPEWLAVANPVVDISAVTAIIGGYALAGSAPLALRSPIFLTYLVILAARPIATSTRKAGAVALLAVVQYIALLIGLEASDRLTMVVSPVAANALGGVSMLDEGAKLLLLAVAGAVATYATHWQEQVASEYSRELAHRAELETRLTRAQLRSLRLQLHPHFLFNALNTVTALIETDARGAERVVSGISELLRASLSDAGEQEVPLARELELLGHYVAIQRERFRDRLTVTVDADPDARQALVPHLVLQPLVENAIRHGIAPRRSPGHVRVLARRANGQVRLEVEDDGVGAPAAVPHGGSEGKGIGLANTRDRLRALYGDAQRFEAGNRSEGGFRVVVELPYHEREVSPEDSVASSVHTSGG